MLLMVTVPRRPQDSVVLLSAKQPKHVHSRDVHSRLSVQKGLVGAFDYNEQKLSQSPGMIAHVYNFSIWKAEAGGLPHV